MNVINVAVKHFVAVFVDIRFVWLANSLEHVIDCVDSETINTAVKPENQNFLHFFNHRRVSVVQIWLASKELMKVALVPL